MLWHLALALCFGLDPLWVATLWWSRLTLSIGCVSGLKEVGARTVGFVRSGSVRSTFDRPFSLAFEEARDTAKWKK